MKSMKKITGIALAAAMALSLGACGSSSSGGSSQAQPSSEAEKSFKVGICQIVQHVALDAATEGFEDALTEEFGEAVKFDEQNAQGDPGNCATIINQFVSDDVDLILANATPPLQAAAAGTSEIPILGTSVTDYASALQIENWTGTVGGNISGTSDLAPLDGQAGVIKELFPDASTVGLLYCSAEANSQYQVDTIKVFLEDMGFTCEYYAFSDSNDLASVVTTAASECDVLYVPTDNTAASNTGIIDSICTEAKVPVVCGEEGICKGCGVATLSINYYDLGYATGKMAIEVLNGGDISTMAVQFAPEFTKEYVPSRCDALGVTVPDGYTAIDETAE